MKNVEVKKTVAAEPEKKVEKAAVRPAAKETAKETETKKTEKAAEVKEVKAAKPAAKKAPAKKPAAKAATVKTKMIFQYYGQEFDPEDIMKKVQKAAAKKADKLKKVEAYVNIEENAVYYVVNGEAKEDYRIQL